jgi:hypothetical protein
MRRIYRRDHHLNRRVLPSSRKRKNFTKSAQSFEPTTGLALLNTQRHPRGNRHADATPVSRIRRRRPKGLQGLVAKDGGRLCSFGSVLRRCRHTSGNDASCGESIHPESCRLNGDAVPSRRSVSRVCLKRYSVYHDNEIETAAHTSNVTSLRRIR